MATDETLLRKLDALQELLAMMEDRDKIQRRQNMYGFYIDNRMWAEGIYENDYVKEDSAWKIERLWWVPTFYTQMDGFDKAVFQAGPECTDFPPDAQSQPQEPALGRSFPSFHYRHPFTGEDVPAPIANQQG
jgi:hypothetical protein